MNSKKQAPVKYYVGIDVGSASVRAALVDEFGIVVAHADQPIQIWEPQPDHYEQSSADIWAACCLVTKVCKENEDVLQGSSSSFESLRPSSHGPLISNSVRAVLLYNL